MAARRWAETLSLPYIELLRPSGGGLDSALRFLMLTSEQSSTFSITFLVRCFRWYSIPVHGVSRTNVYSFVRLGSPGATTGDPLHVVLPARWRALLHVWRIGNGRGLVLAAGRGESSSGSITAIGYYTWTSYTKADPVPTIIIGMLTIALAPLHTWQLRIGLQSAAAWQTKRARQ